MSIFLQELYFPQYFPGGTCHSLFSLHICGLFGPVVHFLFILKFDGRYHLCFHAHNSEFL
jgi:hypothetical protein